MPCIQKNFINEQILKSPQNFVDFCETEYNQRLEFIALDILKTINERPIILLTGPSSSGKTTTAKKLMHFLSSKNVETKMISMDDYYKDIGSYEIPKTEDGDDDLESPNCMDLNLLNEHLLKLAMGEEIDVPIFNFEKRKRSVKTRKIKIEKGQAVIIEGIHALNDYLTGKTHHISKKNIYTS